MELSLFTSLKIPASLYLYSPKLPTPNIVINVERKAAKNEPNTLILIKQKNIKKNIWEQQMTNTM